MKLISRHIYLLLFLFLVLSCSETKINEPEDQSDPDVGKIEVESLPGRIQLSTAANSNIVFSDLDVISFFEDDDIKSDNSFDIDVMALDEHPQMVFVENNDNKLVMAGIVRKGDTEVVINEVSTAKAMVLRNIIFLGRTAEEKEMILDYVEEAPSFQALLLEVTKVIQNDLNNVYDEDINPQLDELSTYVAIEVHQRLLESGLFKTSVNTGIGSETPAISIKNSDKRFVTFSNHNLVYLCAQAKNVANNKKENVFTLNRRNSLLKWYWFGVSDDADTDTKFDVYGTSYTIDVSKGFEPNLQVFNWNTINGRASMMNIMVAVREAMKLIGGTAGTIVLGADVLQTIYTLNKPLIDPEIDACMEAKKMGDHAKALKHLLNIGGIILGEGLAAGTITLIAAKLGLFDKIKGFLKDIAGVIPIIKGAFVVKQLGAETIPFIADLMGGERTYKYFVRTNDLDKSVTHAFNIPNGKPAPPNFDFKRQEWSDNSDVKYKYTITGFADGYANESFKYMLRYFIVTEDVFNYHYPYIVPSGNGSGVYKFTENKTGFLEKNKKFTFSFGGVPESLKAKYGSLRVLYVLYSINKNGVVSKPIVFGAD